MGQQPNMQSPDARHATATPITHSRSGGGRGRTAKPLPTAGIGLATPPNESPALELEPRTVEVPDPVQQRVTLEG